MATGECQACGTTPTDSVRLHLADASWAVELAYAAYTSPATDRLDRVGRNDGGHPAAAIGSRRPTVGTVVCIAALSNGQLFRRWCRGQRRRSAAIPAGLSWSQPVPRTTGRAWRGGPSRYRVGQRRGVAADRDEANSGSKAPTGCATSACADSSSPATTRNARSSVDRGGSFFS